MQDLRFPVEEILGKPGTYRDISVSHDLPGLGNALIRLRPDAPVTAVLKAESVVEGILVTGRAQGAIECSCARCLTELASEVDVEVCELFLAPGRTAPAHEEPYLVVGTEIDLEPMLRDALSLALPANPVCRADCQGLCARCGQDLNETECGCTDDAIDPRWAALAELREKL